MKPHKMSRTASWLFILGTLFLLVVPLLLSVSCGPVGHSGGASKPTPIPALSAKGSPNTHCLVEVKHIPPEAGEGDRVWLEAKTEGGGCGQGPKWRIDPFETGNVRIYQDALPRHVAYVAGPSGTYIVTADWENGSGWTQVILSHQ